MKTQPSLDLTGRLLQSLEEAYARKSWHGPNLRGSIRRVSVEQAVWRPNPQRKCIAEIALHAAYWKYTIRRRLTGEKRGSFALKGSNWFVLPTPFGPEVWKQSIDLLDGEHKSLCEAVAAFPAARLDAKLTGSAFTAARLIQAIAFHDVYHTGQIQTLKAMQK